MADKEERRTIQLKHPFMVSGKEGEPPIEITEICMGRLKTKHLKSINIGDISEDKISFDIIASLISGVADIPQTTVDEIDMTDLLEISKVLTDFIKSSLGSGGTTSTA